MAPESNRASSSSQGEQDEGDTLENIYQRHQTESDCEKLIRRGGIYCSLRWMWDTDDSSPEVIVSDDGDGRSAVTFHPNWSNGTAGIRGSQALIGRFNYWEINVGNRLFGTSLMFGVSTKKAKLHSDEFTNLLGEDEHGWGLSHRGLVYHNGVSRSYCKPFQEYTTVVVGVLFDSVNGQLSFFKNGQDLGVAFEGLCDVEKEIYPTICSTAAKTTMTVGRRQRSFMSLSDRCRHVIASVVCELNQGKESEAVDLLPLPNKIKQYVNELGLWMKKKVTKVCA